MFYLFIYLIVEQATYITLKRNIWLDICLTDMV